jgi:hypothetical protein
MVNPHNHGNSVVVEYSVDFVNKQRLLPENERQTLLLVLGLAEKYLKEYGRFITCCEDWTMVLRGSPPLRYYIANLITYELRFSSPRSTLFLGEDFRRIDRRVAR